MVISPELRSNNYSIRYKLDYLTKEYQMKRINLNEMKELINYVLDLEEHKGIRNDRGACDAIVIGLSLRLGELTRQQVELLKNENLDASDTEKLLIIEAKIDAVRDIKDRIIKSSNILT